MQDDVKQILFTTNKKGENKVSGVLMDDSTSTPHHTLSELFNPLNNQFTDSFMEYIDLIGYQWGEFKINIVVDKFPYFEYLPNVYPKPSQHLLLFHIQLYQLNNQSDTSSVYLYRSNRVFLLILL